MPEMPMDQMMSSMGPQDMRPFHQKLIDMLMMRGQPHDIMLESEGMVDPSLVSPPIDQLNKAFQNSQKLALEPEGPALKALRRFGIGIGQ